jgi:hypothetical protein
MKLCPHCRTEVAAPLHASFRCPGCGRLLADEEVSRWTSIARLANLAETGYFADLLQGGGVPTNVVHHSEFDALEGHWRTIYLLQVPEDRATLAADTLKRELAVGDEDDGAWRGGNHEAARRGPTSVWKPVVIILVAGGLAYCAGRSGVDRPPPARPTHDEFWTAFGDLPAESVFNSHDDGVARKLTIDREARTVFLEEDYDGDGRWDRLRMFREGALVSDTAP